MRKLVFRTIRSLLNIWLELKRYELPIGITMLLLTAPLLYNAYDLYYKWDTIVLITFLI